MMDASLNDIMYCAQHNVSFIIYPNYDEYHISLGDIEPKYKDFKLVSQINEWTPEDLGGYTPVNAHI